MSSSLSGVKQDWNVELDGLHPKKSSIKGLDDLVQMWTWSNSDRWVNFWDKEIKEHASSLGAVFLLLLANWILLIVALILALSFESFPQNRKSKLIRIRIYFRVLILYIRYDIPNAYLVYVWFQAMSNDDTNQTVFTENWEFGWYGA